MSNYVQLNCLTVAQRRRRGAAPAGGGGGVPAAAVAMTAAYRRVHESTGLSMSAVGGWPHVISFMGQTDNAVAAA